MLSPDNKAVYEALKELAGEDGIYKVVEANEVIDKLPEDKKLSLAGLSSIVKDLRDREYIKVKYLTLDEYCLLVLKHEEELKQIVEEVTAATVSTEQISVPQVQPKVKQNKVEKASKNVVCESQPKSFKTFLAGFFGAMIGGGIITAIGFIIQYFVF